MTNYRIIREAPNDPSQQRKYLFNYWWWELKIFLAVVEAGAAQGGAAAKIKEGAKKGLKVAEAGGKKLMDDFKSISAEVSGIFLHYQTPNGFSNCLRRHLTSNILEALIGIFSFSFMRENFNLSHFPKNNQRGIWSTNMGCHGHWSNNVIGCYLYSILHL